MPWKTIDIAARATVRVSPETQSAEYKVVLSGRTAVPPGWYRFKIESPKDLLAKISVEAFEFGKPSKPISSFACRPPRQRFAAYLYISSRVELVEILANLISEQTDDLVITLRPLTFIEYLWHAIELRSLLHPRDFLSYYFRPLERFLISFSFPLPPRFSNEDGPYKAWIGAREKPLTRAILRNCAVSINETPPISILLPVCDSRPEFLKKAIASVRAQTSPNWRLCIADDASTDPEIRPILDRVASEDSRVSLSYREQRGGISAATNTAFSLSASPYITCLDHDDMLAPVAIEVSGRHLAANPDCRLLSSDEDKIDARGQRFMPHFKPRNFSRELFYSSNYLNHMTTHRADTIRQVGLWRSAYDGAQDYDLILRSIATAPDRSIHHIPLVLYHWRAITGSTALDVGYKSYAIDAGRRALADHFRQCGIAADVAVVAGTIYRIRREIPKPSPKVSIIVPFRDQGALLQKCVSSILNKTRYDNFEIILVDNGSSNPLTFTLLEQLKSSPAIRIFHDDGPFNYSRLNNSAAERADCEYLCLLNNDTEVIAEDWLEDMLSYASIPEVGCVGAKLYYPNGLIQHAGVLLGLDGIAGHFFHRYPKDASGYFARLQVASNVSAVTGACLMIRRSTFLEVGGLDEVEFAVGYNDIDLCLKVQARGYRNVFTPFAELIHHESATRGRNDTPEKVARFKHECEVMVQRYGSLLQNDPCYSPNLTLQKGDYSIRLE